MPIYVSELVHKFGSWYYIGNSQLSTKKRPFKWLIKSDWQSLEMYSHPKNVGCHLINQARQECICKLQL